MFGRGVALSNPPIAAARGEATSQYYKVIRDFVCISLYVCLWLNNSKTAEPIGLKLIACVLLGPWMVLG